MVKQPTQTTSANDTLTGLDRIRAGFASSGEPLASEEPCVAAVV
jgi:hypothetical protein